MGGRAREGGSRAKPGNQLVIIYEKILRQKQDFKHEK